MFYRAKVAELSDKSKSFGVPNDSVCSSISVCLIVVNEQLLEQEISASRISKLAIKNVQFSVRNGHLK